MLWLLRDAACAKCHRKESEFIRQPRPEDSSLGTAKAIIGSFGTGQNVLHTSNPNPASEYDLAPDGFYQSAINLADPRHR